MLTFTKHLHKHNFNILLPSFSWSSKWIFRARILHAFLEFQNSTTSSSHCTIITLPSKVYRYHEGDKQYIYIYIQIYIYIHIYNIKCWSDHLNGRLFWRTRLRGLSHEPSSPARTLGLWVRIPFEAWLSVCVYSFCVVLCVGSGLATGWSSVQ
jgi:hypothetical protein